MNDIEITAEMSIVEGEEWLYTKIIVDGKPLVDFSYYAINYWGLIRSVKKSGIHYILTCHCGVAGCVGIDRGVTVNFVGKTVEWYFDDPYPLEGKKFIFDRNLYVKAVRVGFEKAHHLYKSAKQEGKKLGFYPPDKGVLLQTKEFYTVPFRDTIFFHPSWRKIKPDPYGSNA